MLLPRRALPSMTLLCAFEAAARLNSVTAAARELNLTQGAVSKQLKALEETVGSPLFIRERQSIRLTPSGAEFAQDVREALKLVSRAALALRAGSEGSVLNLAVLPTFGTRWLAPRLRQFLAEHPAVTVNLTTRLAPFDFDLDQVDAAIHFGRPDWPEVELDLLMGEEVIPVCSPEMRERLGFQEPEDLLKAPILHLASRPLAWTTWFRHFGVGVDQVAGMMIDQFATEAQAVASGIGVALMPTFLIERELKDRQLIPALEIPPFTGDGRYYLAAPLHRRDYRPLRLFREWLRREAGTFCRVAD